MYVPIELPTRERKRNVNEPNLTQEVRLNPSEAEIKKDGR